MNILLLGSGGREHALAWKLAQSPSVDALHAAPGNPGIARHAALVDLDAGDHGAVAAFCKEQAVDLVLVGPEAPLVAGLADALREAGVAVFGPSREAARLEGSKGYTKDLCRDAGIPTARYDRCRTAAEARNALSGFDLPVVVKADGLAAGKGVVIATTRDEAEEAIASMFDGAFGAAGAEVLVEEFLTGEEVSFFAITDGAAILPFGSAQDHKRVGEGDTGPNTGGMGAYSPAPVFTPELERRAMQEIVAPTVRAMAARDAPYTGVLFAGLMLTNEGPKLIEHNCRFGDPECQVLMMRYHGDLAALMLAAATGALADQPAPRFGTHAALTVVMAARGYPGTPETGAVIEGLADGDSADATIFQAGTAARNGAIVVNGGRVLAATATGKSVREARDRA